MEHLKSVANDEGDSALALLSNATVDVLANEPLRVYSKKVSTEAMPAAKFLGEHNISLLERIKKNCNCSVRPCGTHSKGHFAPSMAVRLSPSVATDALSMGATRPHR
jgi:hypothetical protein